MYTNPGLRGLTDVISSIAQAAGGVIQAVRQPAYFPAPPIYTAAGGQVSPYQTPPYVPTGVNPNSGYTYQFSPAGGSMFDNPVVVLGIGAGLLLLLGGAASRRRRPRQNPRRRRR